MIKTGIVKNALVIGVELISQYMDWDNRNVAVLFGDGAAAVVLKESQSEAGVIAEKLQCYADARQILRVRGMGTMYANLGVQYGQTSWDFDGQEIFRKAVQGMSEASLDVMRRAGVTMADIGLVVPHQANLRIIDAVAKRAGASAGQGIFDRAEVRQHEFGHRAGRPGRSGGRGPRGARTAWC